MSGAPADSTRFDLVRVIEQAMARLLERTHTALPARVRAYDHQRQVVSVTPSIGVREAGGLLVALPPIEDVPYACTGVGAWVIHAPPAPGDEVLLVIAEADLGAWKAGGSGPTTARRMSATDAMAIGGIRRPAAPRSTDVVDADDLTIGREDGSVLLRMTQDGRVSLGREGSSPVDLLALLDRLLSALSAAVVATMLGAQPLDPVAQAELAAIQAELATIRRP